MTRRSLLVSFAAGAAAPLASQERQSTGLVQRFWCDPKIASLPRRPWRKIHLDFHNSKHVPGIGAKFDAAEFGERLAAAHVDSIVVFAKDMHGYFYYPSKYGPVHPGLRFDLLGKQVEECRKRKIAVYAYYCTTWDHYLAEKHPEWLVVKRDGSTYMPKPNQTPSWTALCQNHPDFVDLMVQHTQEFVKLYPLDGAWFDMPIPIAGECFCRRCLEDLRARKLDPNDTAVQRRHKQEIHLAFLNRLRKAVKEIRPDCQVDFNNQTALGLSERAPLQDNIDIEALPTASGWGYYYFPLMVRYARNFGLSTYGMTGRFHRSWADFGGLKTPAQLEIELGGIVANAARCDIGDQMPPNGRLDPAVYQLIGHGYALIRRMEPYLEGAAPVTEAALVVGGLPLDRFGNDDTYGMTKLLMENHVQFDVLEAPMEWERYGLVILSESVAVTNELSARLRRYLDRGGAVLLSHGAAKVAGESPSWLEPFGLTYHGESPFKPAYLVPKGSFLKEVPNYEYALYEGAHQWKAAGNAAVLAQLGVPLFQRSPKQYTSHAQTPFERETEFAAAALSGRVGLSAFPLGRSYFANGYWIYGRLFRAMIDRLLPVRLIDTDAPPVAEIALTKQVAPGNRARHLVHIVNYSAMRASPKHPVYHDHPVPLTDLRIRVNLKLGSVQARTVTGNRELKVRPLAGGAVEFLLPRVKTHEIVALEAKS